MYRNALKAPNEGTRAREVRQQPSLRKTSLNLFFNAFLIRYTEPHASIHRNAGEALCRMTREHRGDTRGAGKLRIVKFRAGTVEKATGGLLISVTAMTNGGHRTEPRMLLPSPFLSFQKRWMMDQHRRNSQHVFRSRPFIFM
jgi:hypothetical protein